ncbi:MAG: hypothetical protein E6G94_10130 [Alphaproteobacteria bacterium]|nr:MAG: hypothetical protein E6G94_10130 [Alphaproteobacteria bacterium]
MSDSEHGTPFGENCTEPIDHWSRAVFEACRDWPLARSGRWFRVEDGWLRLRIEAFEGEPLEPLFVVEVDTVDDQILVDCGSWACPITPPSCGSLTEAAGLALTKARELIERWLSGETKLLIYYDETGWRGHKSIDGHNVPSAIEPVPVEIGKHARVIVKTSRRPDWRSFRRVDDGWLECELNEG